MATKRTKADRIRDKLREILPQYTDRLPTKAEFMEESRLRCEVTDSEYHTYKHQIVEELQAAANKSREVPVNFQQATAAMDAKQVQALAKLSGQVVELMTKAGLTDLSFSKDHNTGEAEMQYKTLPPPAQTVKLQ
jgi:hypothetical protein